MRLVSFRHAGALKFGAAADGGIVDLSERTGGRWPGLRAAIAGKALGELAAATKGVAADFRMDEVELLPAIPDPEKILCIGLNYASHVGEVGRQVKIFWRLAVVEMPVVFIGPRMTRSRMCGNVVMPLPPDPPPA